MMTPVHSVGSSLKLSTSGRFCTCAKGASNVYLQQKTKKQDLKMALHVCKAAYGWVNFGYMMTENRMLCNEKDVNIFQTCGHKDRITNVRSDWDLHVIWN
jgi:hypothetical protein